MRPKGFTLIEVMVTVIILGLGIVGVIAALGNGVDDIRRIRSISTVANALQEQMETVRNTTFSNLSTLNNQTGSISGVSSGSYLVTVSGYDADNDGTDDSDISRVTITASWTQGGGTVQKTLVTLVNRSGINP